MSTTEKEYLQLILLAIIAMAIISMAYSAQRMVVEYESNNYLQKAPQVNHFYTLAPTTVNIEKVEGNGHAIGDNNKIENKV